MQVTEYVPRER